MIQAFFGCYGNQINMKAPCEKFLFFPADMLESIKSHKCVNRTYPHFYKHFDTNIRKKNNLLQMANAKTFLAK